jgi:hypothetical protein
VAIVRRTHRSDLVLASFFIAYYLSLLPLRSHFERYVLPLVPVCGALAGRLRAAAPVTLLLLVVPLTWSIRNDVRLTRTDTRIVAARWISTHLPHGARIAAESSTAVPSGYHVVPLPLPLPWKHRLTTFGELRREARFALVSGAVADRVLRARDRYPREAALYRALDTRARRVFRVDRGDGRSGPWVAVYAL